MRKAMMGVLFGALVYFVMGVVSWMVMPWHDAVIKKLPEETLIRDTLKVVVQEPGMYFFPSDKTSNGRMEKAQYFEHYKNGPAGLMAYTPGGKAPMCTTSMVIGFVGALVAAGFSMGMLLMMRGRITSYGSRVIAILLLGVFVWFNSHIPYWNWMLFPMNYILVILLDHILCFGSMGLVLARFVPDGN